MGRGATSEEIAVIVQKLYDLGFDFQAEISDRQESDYEGENS